jgi:GNAT superfamily N-acetyltransferase
MHIETDDIRWCIRKFRDSDATAVATIWHRAGRAAYTYLPTWQSLSLERAQEIFRKVIQSRCTIWVGTADAQIVAFLAMDGSYLDRLYVDPREWRKGWGTRLIQLAKALSPGVLELHTHQANRAARALYERHGFVTVKYGLSPPPESAPDVEYHWRPEMIGVNGKTPEGSG